VRKAVAILAGIGVLGAANWTILQRERLIETGAVARLELAPVDPRSLMQGDYMALRFALEISIPRSGDKPAEDGHLVVRPDDKGVARYVREDRGEPLAAVELRLRYRIREGKMQFATNAWFFQEGQAAVYQPARYGEFRVAPSGEMLLVAMLGANQERLGQ
jgi:uncharacterized membrane-anchored protein